MDKYSKQAFKITLMLFLAILGLFAFLNVNSIRSIRSNKQLRTAFTCDYGRRTVVWHWWGSVQWELIASLKVEYDGGEDYILDYDVGGSTANAFDGWSYSRYSSSISYETSGNKYTWVKNWRTARFYNSDTEVDVTAWVNIEEDRQFTWGKSVSFLKGYCIHDANNREIC